MGCGQSSENERKNRNSTESASQGQDANTNGGNQSNASPQNTSIAPHNGSQAASAAALTGSSSSFASAPGVTMPTHTITDTTGHKVTSCIGSRNKLEVVTRWLDSVVKTREALPDGMWRNPQEEAGREKPPAQNTTSSQASGGASERSHGQNHSPSVQGVDPASQSQQSLSLLANGSPTNRETVSNQPQYPQSPQNPDVLGPASPVPNDSGDKNEKQQTTSAAKYEIDPSAPPREETTASPQDGAVTPSGGPPQKPTTATNPPPTPRKEDDEAQNETSEEKPAAEGGEGGKHAIEQSEGDKKEVPTEQQGE